MVDQTFTSDFIDRYVRAELSEEEESRFETALLDSPELKAEVEAALGIREAMRLDAQTLQSETVKSQDILNTSHQWHPLALAASVLLAVFSTTMYWKVSNETSSLQSQLDALKQPHSNMVMVSIDVMRSSAARPAAIIQKPSAESLMIINIELGANSRGHDSIQASLKGESGEMILAWASEVKGQGDISVGIFPDQLPNGRVWLEIADSNGEPLERRLIEFLPVQNNP